MMLILIASLIGFGLQQPPASPQIPVRKLSAEREVLKAVVAISTLPPAELSKIPVTTEVEHDSEVSRSELVTVVVMASCQTNAQGECNAMADVVAYKPDGTVHSEIKNIKLVSGRGTATLDLTTTDVTGIYKVVATVRDLGATRFAKTERLFGVK